MAQESCNLNKEEAEILKPSSSTPSNPSPSQPTTATSISNPASSTSSHPSSLCLKPPQEFSAQKPKKPESSVEIPCTQAAEKEPQPPVQFGNRCSSCRKKVGLTGFRCRCGDLFCPRHRYSETHDCSFDYKALGREEISKANPVIRAAKIIKI